MRVQVMMCVCSVCRRISGDEVSVAEGEWVFVVCDRNLLISESGMIWFSSTRRVKSQQQIGTRGDDFDSTFPSSNFHTKIYAPWMELFKMTTLNM